MKNKKKNMKHNNITQLVFSLVIIILINVIGYFAFFRYDLTTEKRYSLSPTTKTLLKELDDKVFFKIYLEGDELQANYKRLRNEAKEMLDEFRAYNKNIQYEFYNPNSISNETEKKEFINQLFHKGMPPIPIGEVNNGVKKQQFVFPYAEVTYKAKTMPLAFLNLQLGTDPENEINNSIQALEYNISNVIRKLSIKVKPKIAIIQGHGELNNMEMRSISYALNEYYQVEWVHLKDTINDTINGTIKYTENIHCLTDHPDSDTSKKKIQNKYKAIIIAKPDTAFSEKEKFIIDQFIMRGGKVLWLIDPVFASQDSLRESNQTMAITNDLNLTDLFFKYGVRLNTNLIKDINCQPIRKFKRNSYRPEAIFFPWDYFPILVPTSKHPIVNNLNNIKTEYISSIDTIENGISKTILLTTSNHSRVVNTPVLIDINLRPEMQNAKLYNKQFTVAMLLEGRFESNYAHRMTSEITQSKEIGFMDKSESTSMIFVSDGDIIKNQFYYQEGKKMSLPLGLDKDYDTYLRQNFGIVGFLFGNKEFILNCMNYLTDGSKFISVRSKDLKLRMLDKTTIEETRLNWQLINVLLPVILIILFGIIQGYIRKRKYSN